MFNRIKNFFHKVHLSLIWMRKGARISIESPFDRRRVALEQNILHSTEPGVTSEKYAGHEIIVSLTTYGKRLYQAALAVESLMEQTVKANRIVLWLSEDMRGRELPVNLQMLQRRGLEIRYCEDLLSYKKLIPSLKAFPKDAIITADDDLVYNYDMIEHLIAGHKDTPDAIVCYRLREIQLDRKGRPLPYKKWPLKIKDDSEDELKFINTGGGTLFPPGCFDDEVFNTGIFLDKCRYADDIWFTAMALKNGTKIKRVEYMPSDCFLANHELQDEGLVCINVDGGANDRQFRDIYGRYNLLERLPHRAKAR